MPGKTGVRLTARGWALFVLGALIAVGGALIGEPDVTWVGLLLAILPLMTALLLVLLLRPRLHVERSVRPSEIPVGSSTRATLALRNQRPTAVTSVDFRDTAPAQVGADARFSLTRGFGRWEQPVGYDVHAQQRGHYRLGPLRARCYDPLGLSTYTWHVRSSPTSLRVTPRIHTLEPMGTSAGTGSTGDTAAQRAGFAGQDDVLVREHRPGDDIRRVHWKLSAKQGELMVRLEEHPWDPALTLLIDNRGVAHVGQGPEGSFEWTISMTASVATELLANRYRLHLVSADGGLLEPGQGDAHTLQERMVDGLTDLVASREPQWRLEDPDAMGSGGSMLGVLGLMTAGDAAALAAAGTRMGSVAAVAPDAEAWGLPPARVAAHDEACRMLEGNGWTVQRYRPGDDVPAVWRALQARRAAR